MTAQPWDLWLTCTIWLSPGEEGWASGLGPVETLPIDPELGELVEIFCVISLNPKV